MQEIVIQHYKEVWQWRTLASVVWTIISLPAVILLYLLIVTLDLLHPVNWIVGCLWGLLSVTSWLYIALLAVIISAASLFTASQYSVQPQILTSRWSVLWNVICPVHLGRLVAFSLMGSIATWCCINIEKSDYVGLTLSCGEDGKSVCLNEPHLFLVLHGLYLGILSTASFYLNNQGYMSFPVIQQAKFFSVKSKLSGLIYKSAVSVLRQLRYFYIIYFCLGNVPKHWIIHTLNLTKSDVDLDTLRGLLDVGLFWHAWLSGTLLTFLVNLSALLFHVYQTEPYQFAVEVGFEEKSGACLNNAIACSVRPLIQYIGYQDLYLLSKYHADRRKVVFSLSQPGGHPHNWNAVSVECLATIDNLANSIVAYNNNAIANGNIRNLSGEKTVLKEMTFSPSKAQTLGSSAYSANIVNSKAKPNGGSFLSMIWQQVKKRPLIAFLVNDLPDTTSRRLFADCQKHIWAIEAISHLTVASYTEDQYGVVQKSLDDILSVLLNLLDAVDKHFILATNMTRRPPRGADHSSDVTLRFALKSALKSALYRIVIRFDKHLEFLDLSPEHKRRLGMFLDLKE